MKLARQVTHANVCRVFDIGEASGSHFLSMEIVQGEDLESRMKRQGRLPQDQALEIGLQLCEGLGAVHEQGILHRDFKPANVLLDDRDRVRLTDFGMAATAGETTPGGTPAYMAPELWQGHQASVQSDLYALGLVLYQLFTGRPAWRADSLAEMARIHTESAPAPPLRLRTSIPASSRSSSSVWRRIRAGVPARSARWPRASPATSRGRCACPAC